MKTINFQDKFDQFDELWTPKIVAELNGQYVKLAKVKGEFVRHKHDDEDEWFHVLKGKLTLRFDDGEVTLGPGDAYVVPRGVAHQPYAPEETHLILFEPKETAHTGDVIDQRTVTDPEWI